MCYDNIDTISYTTIVCSLVHRLDAAPVDWLPQSAQTLPLQQISSNENTVTVTDQEFHKCCTVHAYLDCLLRPSAVFTTSMCIMVTCFLRKRLSLFQLPNVHLCCAVHHTQKLHNNTHRWNAMQSLRRPFYTAPRPNCICVLT